MYTEQERDILSQHFTNTDRSVFALKNLPEVVKGALFSRYSRTAKDLRRLFLDEFYTNPDIAATLTQVPVINTQKAEDFYDRILVGYGDDSIAELGGAHVAIEDVSMLATKAIEEHRIGLSPLEKSTRYVYYDKQAKDGSLPYVEDIVIAGSEFKQLYFETNEMLFRAYSKIVRESQAMLMQVFPGDVNDPAYKFSIRAKACDIARNLLPLSTKTNMGVFGNGRAYEYLITTMLGDRLNEVRQLGLDLNQELSQVIPSFIKRATTPRGDQYREYLKQTHESLDMFVERNGSSTKGYLVDMVGVDGESATRIIAALFYEKSKLSYREALLKARNMNYEDECAILDAMGEHRQVRQHRPLRYTEEVNFTFEIVADWGVYKDLMRHRMLTRHKKRFSTVYGYHIPEELDLLGFRQLYVDAMDQASEAQQKIEAVFPEQSQYLVTHGHYTPFIITANLRALSHMLELRSTPQGHPTYRKVAQDMALKILDIYPEYAPMLKFVDYENYDLERLEAFKKLRSKGYHFDE